MGLAAYQIIMSRKLYGIPNDPGLSPLLQINGNLLFSTRMSMMIDVSKRIMIWYNLQKCLRRKGELCDFAAC